MTLASKRAHLLRPFNARLAVFVSRILVVLAGSIGLIWAWILSLALYSNDDFLRIILLVLAGYPIAAFTCARIIRDFWYWFARERPHLGTNIRYYLMIVGIVVLTAFLSGNDRALRLRFVFEGSRITKTLDAVEQRCQNTRSPTPTYRGRNVSWKCSGSAVSFKVGRWSQWSFGGDYGYVRSSKEPDEKKEYRKVSHHIWVWNTTESRF
jgi:hypothetical protein